MPDATPSAFTAEEKDALVKACKTCLSGAKKGGVNRNVFIHAHTAKRLGLPVKAGIDTSGPKFETGSDGAVVDKTPLAPVKLADLCKAVGVPIEA